MLINAGLGEKKITVDNVDECSLLHLMNVLKAEYR